MAYKAKGQQWWCPSCQTILANEQVHDGRCWRCDSLVEKKSLEQWYFAITKYADRLLNDLEKIDWPESTKEMQRNWIGRSEGTEAVFLTEFGDELRVFTTRADTLFGATFMVLAPEHELVGKLTKPEQKEAVDRYVAAAERTAETERQSEEREKTGVFTGSYAVNPVNNEHIPIWIADYVLVTYGTGAIMAVPAHDQRDFEFAQKFGLDVRVVVQPPDDVDWAVADAYEGEGTLVNSEDFDGETSAEGGNQNHRVAEGARPGRAQGAIPHARLVDFAPALLGRAHSHDQVPEVRLGGNAHAQAAGAAAGNQGLSTDRRRPLAAGQGGFVCRHRVPRLRRSRRA